jgi:hypothetical protein
MSCQCISPLLQREHAPRTLDATLMNPPKTPSFVAGTRCQYEKLLSYLIIVVT